METRILNPLKVVLALATLVLFGFAPVAQADQASAAVAGVQALTKAEHAAPSAATPPDEAGERARQAQPESEPRSPNAAPSTGSSPDPAGEPHAGMVAADGETTTEPAAAPSVGSRAASEPQAAATTAAPETAREPPPATTAAPEAAREPPPATTATPKSAPTTTDATPASAPGISAALQEAILQASGGQPHGSGGGNEPTLVAESNATTQLVWQLQISECIARCSGVTQRQAAEQQNSTRQVLAGALPAAAGQGTPATVERTQAAAGLTQIRLGCLAHCVGTAATNAAADPAGASYLQVLEAVLGKVLQELLGAIAAALPGPSPAPAAQENAVAQLSYQSQGVPGPPLVQTQSVEQSSTTIQLHDPTAALIAGLQRALGGQAAAAEEAVNQTEQGIWQLQVGCLFFCEETAQYQQAVQSNTTVQAIASAPDASTAVASVANLTTQLVWQAQVGCMFWCVNTTQQQIAASQNTVMVIESHPPAAPPPAAPPPLEKSSTPPGVKPVPAAPSPGGSLSPGDGGSPAASSGADTALPAATASVVEGASLASARSTTVVRQRRAAVRGTRGAVIPAGVSSTPRVQLEVDAGLIAPRSSAGGGAGSRASARSERPNLPASEVGARVAAGSSDDVATSVAAAVALAAFALLALSVLRVALPARRG